MLKFILLFSIIISATIAQEFDATYSLNNTFNCYAEYLKRHGVLDETFEVTPFDGEEFLCEMVLVLTVDRLYGELYKEFSENPNFNESAKCIVENLRESKWSNLDLKEQVYQTSDLLTPLEKQQKIKEIKRLQEKISSNAILTCLSEKEFGETFDSIINNSTSLEEDDLVGDYCARKYGIEQGIIDTNEYKINLNPNNIVTTYIQCDVVNKKHFDDAESELRNHLAKDTDATPERIDCYMSKYHENHYFDKTLAIALLGELKLTDEQKERERKKFVSTMVNITRIISEC
ncbi:hypothetical protein PVAND_005675 [Polypedilum vanderplanki]|uniref:Uncharacterized protein n=1 Tax=Polypedilum vanderplanki TaxID=319348 RepID=A0A9J6C0R7_POLVA|nr:hypothetical protein PVAND_005675 [Polypedilum vanderplanki]